MEKIAIYLEFIITSIYVFGVTSKRNKKQLTDPKLHCYEKSLIEQLHRVKMLSLKSYHSMSEARDNDAIVVVQSQIIHGLLYKKNKNQHIIPEIAYALLISDLYLGKKVC